MMKRLGIVLLVLVVCVGVVELTKDEITKRVVCHAIESMTGLTTTASHAHIGLGESDAVLTYLKILNPPGFSETVLLEAPEIYVDYDAKALFHHRTHLEHVRIHIDTLYMVRKEDGQLNIQAIRGLDAIRKREAPPPSRTTPFQLDNLDLKIGKVVFKDLRESPPSVHEFRVNLDEHYAHISEPGVLKGLIISRALIKTSIAQLTNFDVAGLQATVMDALASSQSPEK